MENNTNPAAPPQGESPKPRAVQIEEALLWREMQRVRDQIAPHIVAIVKAFPHHRIGSPIADKIGNQIGKSIGWGIASFGSFTDENVFGAQSLREQLDKEEKARWIAVLVDSFLKRVDEIGEIAEDASLRNEQ